ncbi:MAG TPA: LysR family transcriptional regulator, partial [Mitsuokella multacida]|nr:LysR family transcriptional regulator [Mitsuokella multacida]
MEFRQLEYFCTISELENFTRTAKVLHVSQPSVTKAIKALEAELGLTLIDRSQKHVTLTEAGRAFLIHARRIMQDAELAKQDMMRFCVGSAGTIHFGVPPMFEAYLFPKFFKEFREKFPNTLLDVREFGDSDEVRERVEIGDLDFGVIFGSPETTFPHEFVVMHDDMSLCLPEGHPLAAKKEVAFESLRRERFILQQPRTYQYRAIFARCIEAGFT